MRRRHIRTHKRNKGALAFVQKHQKCKLHAVKLLIGYTFTLHNFKVKLSVIDYNCVSKWLNSIEILSILPQYRFNVYNGYQC